MQYAIIREALSLANNGTEAFALSNFYTSGSGNGSSNSSSFVSRRDIRASNVTGALPVVSVGSVGSEERSYSGSFDFEAMLISLHEIFEHDRQIASQQDARRCGICYLHFLAGELHYRDEEGFYVCGGCERAAGKYRIPMLRRQQK
jgi:hypothetical protein